MKPTGKKLKISGWGKYPILESETFSPASPQGIQYALEDGFIGISRGLGRSYGDSSLAEKNFNLSSLSEILSFESGNGWIHCGSGASLEDSVRAANCAGALTTLGAGAQNPIPDRDKVEQHFEQIPKRQTTLKTEN